ncbi:aminomethyltransferase [Malassezia nana]|uniref:Aminomethyltransferase n=1 Tax=Malassezia nana TaxID=180528 RepID=A0AAF0EPG4_9BASI|nr:aminomethyltransferase [Malassezia nana]
MIVSNSLKRSTMLRIPTASLRIPANVSWASSSALHTSALRREEAKTCLYHFHVKHGAKMVPFGGFSMPLTYEGVGQVASHKHVREHAGLFDVSHMVQHMFEGNSAMAFLQHITPASLKSLPPFSSTLSVFLSEEGGILDDLIITKHSDTHFYVVTNAGRRHEDLAFLREQLDAWNRRNGDDGEVTHHVLEGRGLIALQGPSSARVMQKHLPEDFDLSKLVFGQSAMVPIRLSGQDNAESVMCHLARGGYTGEDGFEISIPREATEEIARALLDDSEVELAGLAARDSLRLEAGMCLYGHDLDESVSPIEGALAWTVGKDRREAGDFLGAQRVLKELKEGPPRRRIGLIVSQGSPAREGTKVFAEDGTTEIGRVTSGIPSPTLGQNIAMALVKNGYHKKDTKVFVEVRNKKREAMVARMPFVPNKFYRG